MTIKSNMQKLINKKIKQIIKIFNRTLPLLKINKQYLQKLKQFLIKKTKKKKAKIKK